MGAVSRLRALDRTGDTNRSSGLTKCCNIVLPTGFVEIGGQQPARLVLEQRVDTHDMAPGKMVVDDLVTDR